MEKKDFSREDKFSLVVLKNAKSILGEESKYLSTTRMTKLVVYIAEKVNFDFTYGWYRFGAYSPSAYNLSNLFAEDNLESFNPPMELVKEAKPLFQDKIHDINRYLKKRTQEFRKKEKEFYKWIYEYIAPRDFRGLYSSHQNLDNFFDNVLQEFETEANPSKKFLDNKYHELGEIITEHNKNVLHVDDDDEILDLYYEFTDLLEMLMLTMKNLSSEIEEEMLLFFRKLKGLYSGGRPDIWETLVPYRETLKGPKAEEEKRKYNYKVNSAKKALKSDIRNINDKFSDFLPSEEELREEINRHDKKRSGERKSIRETYFS